MFIGLQILSHVIELNCQDPAELFLTPARELDK